MSLARQLRALIPLLSVFGGAVGRQILEGKAQVGKITPICAETAHLLPEDFRAHPNAAASIYDYLALEHYTRMDDAKRETLAGRYLPAPQVALLEAPKIKKVTDKKTGEVSEVADEPGVAQQMRYGFEVFSAGTVFSCAIRLNHVTELEFEAFMAALRAWSQTSTIGGRAASGMGQVALSFPGWATADPLLKREDTAVGEPFGALYRDHLASQAGAILSLLGGVA